MKQNYQLCFIKLQSIDISTLYAGRHELKRSDSLPQAL